jgi:uncharacterized protein YraI
MSSNSKLLGVTLSLSVMAAMALVTLARAQVQSPPMPAAQPPDATPPQASPPQAAPPQAGPSVGAPSGAPPQAGPSAVLPKSATVISNLNLRAGPGTDSEILATIPGGSTVRVTTCDGEWCAVTWNGRDGYAISRNLDMSGRRMVRRYRPQPYYDGGPQVVYEPPVYYPPPVVYAPGYYYGPRYYGYGPRWGYRWRRW